MYRNWLRNHPLMKRLRGGNRSRSPISDDAKDTAPKPTVFAGTPEAQADPPSYQDFACSECREIRDNRNRELLHARTDEILKECNGPHVHALVNSEDDAGYLMQQRAWDREMLHATCVALKTKCAELQAACAFLNGSWALLSAEAMQLSTKCTEPFDDEGGVMAASSAVLKANDAVRKATLAVDVNHGDVLDAIKAVSAAKKTVRSAQTGCGGKINNDA
ncbi:hypothetical protein PG993_015065 [Apiospora rasikravindrae]|uniref:Uncharacterized protein n=1 Tax=Apiospora rasikravindrae TaxID=990691 RepID=A0ABR1RPI1_9PEZI